MIEHFMELQYFTKLTSLYASSSGDAPFYNCRNLKTIKIPEGVTTIENIHHIERGYENIVEKLNNIGANIDIIEEEKDVIRKQLCKTS